MLRRDSRWIIGDWQGCRLCTPDCKRRRAVKCVRPVGRGEQDVDVIEDSYCQGPKPKESESCAGRQDRNAADGKRELSSARSSALTRQNDFIKATRVPTKTALGGIVEDRRRDTRSWMEQAENPDLPHSIDSRYVKASRNKTADLIPLSDSRNSANAHQDRPQTDKRSGDTLKDRGEKEHKIQKGEVVVDKEDIRNLTLTIILERNDENAITNFPKDFEPQPPTNSTEFTLIGMDALRYIQRIQEEARASSKISIFRG